MMQEVLISCKKSVHSLNIELQLTAEKEDLRVQLEDLKRVQEEDERISKTTPMKEKNDAGDEDVKSSQSGISIEDEEKEEFQGQLQVWNG